ncbi:putative peptide modification system cyclase [Pseudoluteimonas lycopersici]|uniref:Putative peptide modification system cyclase n=1 Tax=Pseudoluteimonas lycopersici TaxID=1324796 RepID=A0A516V8J4_9GAMM|nr:putative peptide modification system cyclase [Lysobacter lycopersici]
MIDTVVESRADVAPRLRTLLLTDLCNSTELVEKLGDTRSAELFQAHDRLVLELQQRWRARLIDRSDGLLLLFERAIDGLGFALDYTRGLRELGKEQNATLQSRAGLHVGEVLTWQNSSEAVNLGAKPLEVEGLAKPMAARLMALARPGQILVSAVAEPLAHRAARELGPRGEQLLWKSWGRWRFKGVPGAQEIFEVGEAGVAPLRVPRNGPKAWRDIPLWRRPAALVAEAAVLAGIATGVWFATRPQPAIAFAERDWVVVGDLRNVTGDARLDDALEQAFRISLEQSRYVNVLSDLKARDTLGRMQRPANTTLDRAIASEIALRDGARAVILPTVAEVGGHLRVSAEVIDPHTQTTVYAAYADGKGASSALASVDDVTEELRQKLGEALASVQKDSKPLPQVSTANLDALKAYALGQDAYGKDRFSEALQLYQQATTLDPKFALAWIGQARTLNAMVRTSEAMAPLHRAQQLRDRLPPREAMYLDGWSAELEAPDQALAKWELLAKMYPDFGPGPQNVAIQMLYRNRYADALAYLRMGTDTEDEDALFYDMQGRALLGLENYTQAAGMFERALQEKGSDSLRRRADVFAAQRKFAEAETLLAKAQVDNVYPWIDRISVAADKGDWANAFRNLEAARKVAGTIEGDPIRLRAFAVTEASLLLASGKKVEAGKLASGTARQSLRALEHDTLADLPDELDLALSATLVALRAGDGQIATEALVALDSRPHLRDLDYIAEMKAVVRAWQSIDAGRGDEAIALLKPFADGSARYQTHQALMQAYLLAGNRVSAAVQAKWLQQRRGLAYIEQGCGQCRQTLNVIDSNQVNRFSAKQ